MSEAERLAMLRAELEHEREAVRAQAVELGRREEELRREERRLAYVRESVEAARAELRAEPVRRELHELRDERRQLIRDVRDANERLRLAENRCTREVISAEQRVQERVRNLVDRHAAERVQSYNVGYLRALREAFALNFPGVQRGGGFLAFRVGDRAVRQITETGHIGLLDANELAALEAPSGPSLRYNARTGTWVDTGVLANSYFVPEHARLPEPEPPEPEPVGRRRVLRDLPTPAAP